MSVYSQRGKGWRYDFIQKGNRYTSTWFKTKMEAKRAEAKRPPVTVTIPNDTPNIDLTLKLAATIRGTVAECDTSPPLAVESVTVRATDWDTGDRMEGDSTDSEGNYILDALPTGKYQICVDTDRTKYLEMCRDASFEVTGGKEYDLDLCLYAGGSISGKVTLETSGEGIEMMMVILYDSDGSRVDHHFTDSNGNYAFWGLESGNYYLNFARKDKKE